MSGEASEMGWHVGQCPMVAWLETAAKLAATAIGIVAFAQALAGGVFWRPAMLTVWQPKPAVQAQWIVLIILSVGLAIATLDRIRGREVVALVCALPSDLGHWGMLFALASKPGSR